MRVIFRKKYEHLSQYLTSDIFDELRRAPSQQILQILPGFNSHLNSDVAPHSPRAAAGASYKRFSLQLEYSGYSGSGLK